MKQKLIIANLYRAKNKSSFFALHQATTRLSEFDIEFHILWDDDKYHDEWSDKIDNSNFNIVSYSKDQLKQYCLEYGINQEYLDKFDKFKAIYFIIHGHYLKNKNITDYYLIYDDDIILTENIEEFKQCLENKKPCLIS